MKTFSKSILVAAVALLSSAGAFAQKQEVLTFTRIERNPRASALAGAGAASLSRAAYASFTNAAIIPFYEKTGDFAAGYQYWAPSLGASHAVNAAGAFKFGAVGVALGGVYQMEQPDFDGFRPSALQVNAGFGAQIASWLGFGVNARFVRENLFQGKSNNAFGADVMVLVAPVQGLSVTAGVANLGSSIKDQLKNEYPQPASLRVAAAYRLAFAKMHAVEVMVDEDYYYNSKTNAVAFGAEYGFNDMVFARVGYRLASQGAAYGSHLGVGLGVQYAGFRLDVSYLTASEVIGNSLCAGLGFSF